MGKAIKWILITIGGLIILLIAALLIIPLFVDMQKYKPEIEKKVTEVTGRPFSIKGNMDLSLFPWAGVSLSEVHLGNPPDFGEKDFLSIKSFEVRVKLLPLLFKDIQVKRFILDGPRVELIRDKNGRGNWEGIGKSSEKSSTKGPAEQEKSSKEKAPGGLPISALAVGEFAITNGSVIWIDQGKKSRKEISDITLRLKDVSLDRPIRLALSASLDGNPLSLEGSIGPIGKDPGVGELPINISLKALKQLDMGLKGKITDAATKQAFNMDLEVSPFSPRKLSEALGQTFPITTADPNVLQNIALKAKIKGDPKDIAISGGTMDLDQSKLTFSARAKEFTKPDIALDLSLDKINLDRYLPQPVEKKSGSEKKAKEVSTSKGKTIDYVPLRKLVLDAKIRIGELEIKGAKIRDILVAVAGKNGLFRLNPFSAKLYEGELSSNGTFDVRPALPKTNVKLLAQGLQVRPLVNDLMKKDFIEGNMKADMAISMEGDTPDRIKKTLNGKGDLLFQDGAILGIDLAGMVRNIKATFGLAEKGGEKPKTDFSEFEAPFTITNGTVKTSDTRLVSPLIRVTAQGKANLVDESLDFRVEPKFVATLKGQGDAEERTGITVPVLISGSFSSPGFRPDLKGMATEMLKKGVPDTSKLGDMLKEGLKGGKEEQPLEEKAKGLLKGFMGR